MKKNISDTSKLFRTVIFFLITLHHPLYHIIFFLSVVLIQHFSFINLLFFFQFITKCLIHCPPKMIPIITLIVPFFFLTIKLLQKFHLKMNPLNSINVCFTLLNITTSELVQEMVLLWQVSTHFWKQC